MTQHKRLCDKSLIDNNNLLTHTNKNLTNCYGLRNLTKSITVTEIITCGEAH